MRRVILTGAPGSGKTVLLRLLERQGHVVIEEAATDVIALEQACGVAEPWKETGFVDAIVNLQRQRRELASRVVRDVVFFDRSPICTYALALHLNQPVSSALEAELARIEQTSFYDRRVLFLDSLGSIAPTAARRIDLLEATRFGALHEQAYARCGYTLIKIPKASLDQRAAQALAALAFSAG